MWVVRRTRNRAEGPGRKALRSQCSDGGEEGTPWRPHRRQCKEAIAACNIACVSVCGQERELEGMPLCFLISLTLGYRSESAVPLLTGSCSHLAHMRGRPSARERPWHACAWWGPRWGCVLQRPLQDPMAGGGGPRLWSRYFCNWMKYFVISTCLRRRHLPHPSGGLDHLLGRKEKCLPLGEESGVGGGCRKGRQLPSVEGVFPWGCHRFSTPSSQLVCTSPCLSKHPGTFLAAPLAACTPGKRTEGWVWLPPLLPACLSPHWELGETSPKPERKVQPPKSRF